MRLKYPHCFIVVSRLDYIFVFLCVLFLGAGTILTQGSLESLQFSLGAGFASVLSKLFMVILSLFVLRKHKVSILSCFNYKIVGVILIWSILQYVKFRIISPFPIVRLFNLYFAGVLILCYKKKLLYIFENIVVKLSLLAIFGWILIVLIPDFVDLIMLLSPIEGVGLVDGNSWLVFASGTQEEIVRRNIGFAWEPGRFGSIVSIALFFNLIAYRFKVRNNWRFFILTIAIFSTQSTTALSVYLCVLIIYLYNLKRKYFIYAVPILSVIFISLLSLGFMLEKMRELSIFDDEHMTHLVNAMSYYASKDEIYIPQRFDALLLESFNIINSPFIGNGFDPSRYIYELFHLNVSLSNGVLRIFANFGLLIGFLYYYLVIKASIWMSNTYRYKGTMAFFILFVLINVSYSWIFEPLFLALVLYPIIVTNNKIRLTKDQSKVCKNR